MRATAKPWLPPLLHTLYLFFIGLSYSLPAVSAEIQPLLIDEEFTEAAVANYGYGLHQQGGSSHTSDIINSLLANDREYPWQPTASFSTKPFAGISSWARIKLHNQSASDKSLIFANPYAPIRKLDAYIIKQGKISKFYQLGVARPLSSRPIAHRWHLVPIELAPGEQAELILWASESAKAMLQASYIYDRSLLHFASTSTPLFSGIIFGMVLLFALLSLLVCLTNKDPSHLWYTLSSLALFITIACRQGYAYEIWFTEQAWFNEKLFNSALIALAITQAMFANAFMQLHKNLYLAAIANYVMAGAGALVIIAFWLSHSETVFRLSIQTIPLVIPVLAINLLASLYLWYRKNLITARDYFFSWGVYSLVLGGFLTLAFHDIIVVANSSNVVSSAYVLVAALLFISMLRRLDQLRYDRERALAESKAKSDFLAKMSHEIRTPMNGVLGMSELLADTKLNDIQRYYTNVIYSSGHALLDVINEILDYSKIAAGKMKLENSNFDIRQLAQDSISIFTAKAREKKIDLVCRICPETPTIWLGDEARIRQVLINLLGNACKFTEAGEVVLNIENDPNHGLCFSVRDTGIGIKESEYENLFEDFSQADVSTSRKYGGTGLGLTICKQLVEMMGGEIRFNSRYGLGSTFSFWLPLAISENGQPYHINTAHLHEKRILLADDNDTFRQIVREQFGDNHLTIIEARHGQEALDLIDQALAKGESFDLISLDIDMPIKGGIETAKAIQKKYGDKHFNIILLSSTSALPSIEDYQQWGVSYAGQKPILAEQLNAVFSRILRLQEYHRSSDKDEDSSPEHILHILVAEDNDVNFQVVSAMLRKHGHIVQRATNGIHALEMFKGHNLNVRSRPFDLILMDCEMPEMNGLSATAAIRELERIKVLPAIPIIALTAHAVEEQLDRCHQAGMNDVITKPFTRQKLNQCLEDIKPAKPQA